MKKDATQRFEELKRELEIINKNENSDYEIISDFKRRSEKVRFRVTDKRTGKPMEFEMTPHNFFYNGYRFPKGYARRKGTKEFIAELEKLYGKDYTVLEEYINSQTPILVRHEKCGREYKVRPNDILQGKECAQCKNSMKLNTTLFKERVRKLVGDEYTVKEEYTNSDTPILLLHNKCGHEFYCPPKEFTGKKQRRCPYCNGLRSGMSIGAAQIANILKTKKVPFKKEFRVKIDNKVKRFDFKIDNSNLFIEFDGAQHFKEGHFYFKDFDNKMLADTQESDNLKNNFIINSNATLLRLPYSVNSSRITKIVNTFLMLNDQSNDVDISTINKDIIEMGGLLVYNYPSVRYDLINYRKINV